MKDPAVTRMLAQFFSKLRYEDLPPNVVGKTKELILDQLGCELASATLPWNRIVYEYAKSMGARGRSTVVTYGLKTNPEYAAVANATFGHGFEIDDCHLPCLAHPGCVAVPSVLAVGEEQGISGKDYILGVAVASDIILRVGKAMMYSAFKERGFHMVSTEGPLGAAAGVGRILDLDEDKLLNAISIAASHSSAGTLEYTQTGGDSKRLHAGMAAVSGIRSALLAQRGFTGPPTILEGKKGLFQALANSYDASKATEGLGEIYEIMRIQFKPYCCCQGNHGMIEAVTQIMKENGLTPSDIEEMVVGTHYHHLAHLGTIGPRPKDILGAQFSAHFTLGLLLAKGANDYATYIEAMMTNFQDPKVIEFAEKVRVVMDEECERAFPLMNMAKATVKTKDGRVFHAKVDYARGSPGNPMSQQELEDKFISLATVALPMEKAQKLKEALLNLEALDNVRKLSENLAA